MEFNSNETNGLLGYISSSSVTHLIYYFKFHYTKQQQYILYVSFLFVTFY
jgi:hypothetical protein